MYLSENWHPESQNNVYTLIQLEDAELSKTAANYLKDLKN